ncbi:MAG: glycoside hydrolase clan, partial [Phycisphaerales bacterium]|nr:glycoside hydrolase clan [Phycisphaerales bacterium]
YGFNDWYYAYGKNSPAGLLADAQLLSELAAGLPNRPYCVIDDGWQTKTKCALGQWSETRAPFDCMADLAAKMKAQNVRPGIWMRPLIDEIKAWPAEWHLAHRHGTLDPTRQEVLDVVAADIRRLTEWGYELIKHDFSTYDLLGDWGPKMAQTVTPDGWSFASRTHTTAEVINRLYKTIRDAAGKAVVIGCNTVSHLTAGAFELNRIGDDTSGNEWHRNPQMGVNTLAFRGIQHDTFYGADADCAPITNRIEWAKLEKWLDLLSRSGTPLFVSVDRAALTPQIRGALRNALVRAAVPLPLAEPLDWLETPTPARWKIGAEIQTYDWS